MIITINATVILRMWRSGECPAEGVCYVGFVAGCVMELGITIIHLPIMRQTAAPSRCGRRITGVALESTVWTLTYYLPAGTTALLKFVFAFTFISARILLFSSCTF